MTTPKIALFTLLAFLIIPITAIGCGNNKAAEPTPTATLPIPTVTVLSADDSYPIPSNFITYTDTNNVFSISYPDDWELVSDIIDDAQGFLENYSKNSELSIDENQIIFTAGKRYSSRHITAINIMLMDCPPFFSSINDNFIALMASGIEASFENSSELSREIITISGREAAILGLEAEISDSKTVYIIVMFTISRGHLWSITCMVNAEMQDEYEGTFNAVVRSLVILNDNSTPNVNPSITMGTNQSSIENIFSSVAEIRGLAPTAIVPYEFISSEELTTRVNEIYNEEYSEDEAAIDQEIYVLLDMLDDDEDLRDIIVDVQSEQIAGYYDDESKNLNIVNNEAELGAMDKITISHEYTHALQDQHFNFSIFPLEDKGNSDRALAALSLIEGDASLCSFMYAFNKLSTTDIEELFNESVGLDSEKLDNAPSVISETLMFPYEAGLDFIVEAYEEDGWETINDAYTNPPQSTEQILHPEKYWNASDYDEPQTVDMPDLQNAIGTTWKFEYTDVLGELTTRIYLDIFIDTAVAKNASEGWDGDCLQYWKDNQGKQLLIMYSTWDTVKDADEYFNAYIKFMDIKTGGSWNITTNNTYAKQWTTTNESIYLSEKGQYTLVVIGTDANVVSKTIAQFPK